MAAHSLLNLTIDIETWGGPNKPTIDDVSAPANYKDPEKIQAYKDEKLNSAWGDQGLSSIKGEICCIGYQLNGGNPVSITGEEQEIIRAFANVLKDNAVSGITQVYWIGHNIAKFDLPWILHRSWKYWQPFLTSLIPTNPYSEHIVDTMVLFAGPGNRDPRNMCKLGDIAKFFGFEGKSEGFDGSMVHDAFIRGEIKKIAKYCENDCEQTTLVSKVLKPEIW